MQSSMWIPVLAVGVLTWMTAGTAFAQENEIEVDRAEVDIARPHPEPHTIESVLVFTNRSYGSRRVRCIAWDQYGQVVGRVATAVPALGVRYILASDFGRGFLGQANCYSLGRVTGSGFLVSPHLTPLPTENGGIDHVSRMRFDVIAYRH